MAIAAGSTHSLALRADGTVVAWGSEPFGNPTTPPASLSNIIAIASEAWHNLALRAADRISSSAGDTGKLVSGERNPSKPGSSFQPSLPKGFEEMVAGGGIEPPTQGFSVLCSTN